ncbi:hypothetical protein PYCCODRAFT_651120 [Trametes coccinea BRFM310]|uniref:Uncharacterized protein n=1 Tax=Trametes coccinea (strain BRFM310) TaxID=1353009 RepID=A0A1Y2IID1_TRAC3|nr:hypothetical protein PYCCODRAFT_651120 [Trametes coccinea BRFM310]
MMASFWLCQSSITRVDAFWGACNRIDVPRHARRFHVSNRSGTSQEQRGKQFPGSWRSTYLSIITAFRDFGVSAPLREPVLKQERSFRTYVRSDRGDTPLRVVLQISFDREWARCGSDGHRG